MKHWVFKNTIFNKNNRLNTFFLNFFLICQHIVYKTKKTASCRIRNHLHINNYL